jgi:alpha-galactosidase
MRSHCVALPGTILVLAGALLLCAAQTEGSTRPVATRGTAGIWADDGGRSWSIGNDQITLQLSVDSTSSYRVGLLTLVGTGRALSLGADSDALVVVNGVASRFGSATEGWTFVGANVVEGSDGVRLGIVYDHGGHRARVTRWYAASSSSPTLEVWSTFEAAASSIAVGGEGLWKVTLPTGDIHWLTGLQATEGESFTLQTTALGSGQALRLGATGRSSERVVPWFTIDEGVDTFYAGIEWSGEWSAQLDCEDDNLKVAIGLPTTATTVVAGTPLETPHVFLGVARGPAPDVAASLRSFLRDALRQGRGWEPLVTFNTWFAYGTSIDENTIRRELAANARIGTELFVVDAGWYPGAKDVGDFTSGLGLWTVDSRRFPNGLGALADLARSLGMKFGIWVEPERVDLETVFTDGTVDERWLATHDGKYDPDLSPDDTYAGQICLANPEARAWVLERLVEFITKTRPDYLKWDNNLWVNCNRTDHGHGHDDGNFRHVEGLYAMLAELRERFPSLVIENVSGGGNRMDFGMARLTETGWMDDHSAPSVHVRHNLEGLAGVFPPAYLLSFVMPHEDEPIDNAPDLSMYVRSRMPGTLGLCIRTAELEEGGLQKLAREITIYKSLRDVLRNGTTTLLTAQATATGETRGWDALQASSPDTEVSVVFAYQQDDGIDEVLLLPRNLMADREYRVRTVDEGVIGSALGADLMADGISLHESATSNAHIIILEPTAAVSGTARTKRR